MGLLLVGREEEGCYCSSIPVCQSSGCVITLWDLQCGGVDALFHRKSLQNTGYIYSLHWQVCSQNGVNIIWTLLRGGLQRCSHCLSSLWRKERIGLHCWAEAIIAGSYPCERQPAQVSACMNIQQPVYEYAGSFRNACTGLLGIDTAAFVVDY